MGSFSFLVLLLCCRIQAAGAQLMLSPQTLTVLRGDEARYTCTTTNTQWTVMVWLLNGEVVLTISSDSGVLPTINPNVTAEESSRNTWVFILKNSERRNQGQVACDLQGIGRKTASLFVQERGSVEIFVDDKLVFKGLSVLLECQAAGWYPQPTLQWQVNAKKVSRGEYNVSDEESDNGLFTVTSDLRVTPVKSSDVNCLASVSALPMPLTSSVQLTVVAEVVEEDHCTVPLAVTASLSALLLLLLICICTVLWYTRRRQAKPSSQEETRFSQSDSQTGPVAEATGGKVNLGYACEGPTDALYNELIVKTSSQTGSWTGSQMDVVSFHKVPDVVSSSSLSLHTDSQARVCLSEESSKNVRRITTV